MTMRIVVGADVAGLALKDELKKHLQERGDCSVADIGMYNEKEQIPYYEVSATASRMIQNQEADRAILCCGTGMGVAIVANKFKGVYASVVESEFTGLHCNVINNANVLTMGGWVVTPYRAARIVDQWLSASFTEGYDEIADFLQSALDEVKKIENQTMK